jgi:HD-like signal output (HDOD) protein
MISATDRVVRTTIDRVAAIATLPSVAIRIMQIADDPSANEDTLHDALLTDPALAARVLKVVNSAFYRRQREVANPRAAIRLLGVDSIRNIALAASLHRLFRGRRSIPGFDPGDVWNHCVAVGTAARTLAVRTGVVSPEEAMLAGLLHDIGVIVAMQAWLPEFTQLVQRAGQPDGPTFRELERHEIGATHEEFGGALCDAWHFPTPFVLACQHHHDFRMLPWHEQRLPALIHVADVLAARIGVGYTATVELTTPLPEALEVLQLTPLDVSEVEAEVADAIPQAVSLLAA